MALEEYVSTFRNGYTSGNYAVYIRSYADSREYTVCGKIIAAVMECGEIRLTMKPIAEYEPALDRWFPTQFANKQTVQIEDVEEFLYVPAVRR